ncbi:MAG: T9SS type A sorting domain-containing protein [Flavobacteriales bacterium]|nr:T9SS type A sorting domain-containing protein [Flavobacteriales bacterium]
MDPATDWASGQFSTDVQATDTQVSCGAFTWVDGNTYATDNNTATYTFTGGAVGGCDNIVTLDLTVNAPVDNTISVSNDSILTSNDVSTGVQYQWIDCGNNNDPISGETSQSFTASTTGLYAVVVTGANGCTDTSACTSVDFASLNESNLESVLNIAPNPTNGLVAISSANYSGEATIRVVDLSGKVISESVQTISPNASAQVDLSGNENGVYIVHISDANESYAVRVLKK